MSTRIVILASLATTAVIASGCGGSESDSGAAAGTTTDTAVSGQQPSQDGGRFQLPPDVTAPTAVMALAAQPGSRLGTIEVVLSVPEAELDYAKIELRREIGSTPSGSCEDEDAVIVTTYTEDFSEQSTFVDTALKPGITYSYLACAFDEEDNVAAKVSADASKPNDEQRVFVTSEMYTGDLTAEYNEQTFESGLEGADYRCQKLATDAELGGDWRAILAQRVKVADAYQRIPVYGGRIKNTSGEIVAVGRDYLYNDTVSDLQNGIIYDETGTEIDATLLERAWTGSLGYNSVSSLNRLTCADWSSSASSESAVQGVVGDLDDDWLIAYTATCDGTAHLYCMEVASSGPTSPTIAIAEGSTAGTVDVTVDFPDDTTGLGRVVLRRGQGLNFTSDACLTNHPWGSNVKVYDGSPDEEFTDETYTDTPATAGQYHYELCVFDAFNNLVEVVHPDEGIVVGTNFGRVFVSSTSTTGAFSSNALTGTAAADDICETLATSAGLTDGTYEALLATTSASFLSRLTVDRNFYDLAGNFLFGSSSDVTSGYIGYLGVTQDETGAEIAAGTRIWTGSYYANSTASSACSDWTSSSSGTSGYYGNPLSYLSYEDWYSVSTQTCDQTSRLYCIQQ